MPIRRDKENGCFVFEFDRRIEGQRVRAVKSLPKAWNRLQADAFDHKETARLYAVATGASKPDHLIEDAVAAYLVERVPKLKHGLSYAKELANIAHLYEGKPMSALPDVCKAIALKGKGLAPATVKNRMAYLRSACRYAWKTHAMGDTDPGARISVPQVKNARQVYIERDQMLRLARACKHRPTRAAIRVAFYSGMRLSEIERAIVQDGRFVLHDSKNSDPRIIPIHPKIRCCVHYKLETRYKTSYHYRKARKAVGLDWLHFHDLRHSAASELINQGVDLFIVGAVLGHRSAASTKRYAHLATSKMEEAILKMGKKTELVRKSPSGPPPAIT